MTNNFFVSHETALQLKEKGFNEPCCAYYRELLGSKEPVFHVNEDKYKPMINSELGENKYNMVCAPNILQVKNWFIDNYDININVEHDDVDILYLKARFKNKKNQHDCISMIYTIHDIHHNLLTINMLIQECLRRI
jgi:hypothetical protein